MVPEARRVRCFPSFSPDGKSIQSVCSPGCPTQIFSVGSGKFVVVTFLKCPGCSDVAPLTFRGCAALWPDATPLQEADLFPLCKGKKSLSWYRRTLLHLCFLHERMGEWWLRGIPWLEEIPRKVQTFGWPTCCCLGVLTSACLHSLFWILADSSALLNGSWGIANRSLSANSALEGQARLPSAHSKKLLSFNCWYQIVDLPS